MFLCHPLSAAVTGTHQGQAVRHDPDVECCRHASRAEGHVPHSAGRTDSWFKGLLGWHRKRREEEPHTGRPFQLTSRRGVSFSPFLIHSCQTRSGRRQISLCVKWMSVWRQRVSVGGGGRDGGGQGGGGDLRRLGGGLPLTTLSRWAQPQELPQCHRGAGAAADGWMFVKKFLNKYKETLIYCLSCTINDNSNVKTKSLFKATLCLIFFIELPSQAPEKWMEYSYSIGFLKFGWL